MYKVIYLSDDRYFEIFIGERVLIKDIIEFAEGIPIYSSNVTKIMGYTDKSNIDNFDKDYVIWGIDGNFDLNIIGKGTVFATTDHCGAIRIKDVRILPDYILYCLKTVKGIYGFDRSLRSSLGRIGKIGIPIPFTNEQEIDVSAQQTIVSRFNEIRKIKIELSNIIEELNGARVEINPGRGVKELKVDEIFELKVRTNSSELTKYFVNKHAGDIPVYSATKDPNYVNYGYIKDGLSKVKYFENCLTWNIDGSVGNAHYREGRFSLSEKVIPLIIKDKYKPHLDYLYLKYSLEKEAAKLGFTFSHKAGKTRIRDMFIPIPTKGVSGDLDLDKQREIARRYEKIKYIKDTLISDLEYINNSQVIFTDEELYTLMTKTDD